ncbi:hypothetical protein PR003_g15459 [Phytophthora rubi]|uniref:Secreted protein n=1 Tax=Phytophthora rubi TaxID=129364 RepID=A0A6A3LFC8_9STRA|nr:hypothetical protein PR002_g15310 [Phytophthora rubi]KAE9017280.1 hypothetical protein PR001_g14439 [Phytophthora rubi]KAE9329814.1 hypothetical protein PR003_g15459 [Phytophthora rubi]
MRIARPNWFCIFVCFFFASTLGNSGRVSNMYFRSRIGSYIIFCGSYDRISVQKKSTRTNSGMISKTRVGQLEFIL